ncbi:hypothetical protein DNI29_15855 [Hymenobacter sediminis]|uniref:hypothetical protein n=1 Tax=Hymenobacter sediminis TaxID=2218621 RepID=UPI000DA6DA8A|nr:hypothetical protein [Hymenobacter sediminis]RPD45635.1 hypothetical protein DNI29_15855 [Hymenobacter sediminis]
MAIWQYSLRVLPSHKHQPNHQLISNEDIAEAWASSPVFVAPIAERIDLLLPRPDWSTPDFLQWKGDDEQNEDHDCWISVALQDQTIQGFSFRTDFRDLTKARYFLSAMLKICEERMWLVVDAEGYVWQPELASLLPSIEQSSTIRFLTAPYEFLQQALKEQNRE